MEYIVEVRDLHKSYLRNEVLRGINLHLKPGKILGLLGPNGSGKSTLLKVLAGLTRPSSGEVLVRGEKPSARTKNSISFLPEKNHLYTSMTVKELLDFTAPFYPDWQYSRAEALLKRFELGKDQKIEYLSKGKISCLKLLLCFARTSSLLLLDEPFSGIDIQYRGLVVETVLSEYRMDEQAIILSTHEIDVAEALFDEVAFIRDGQIVIQETADDLRSSRHSSIQGMWESVYRGEN